MRASTRAVMRVALIVWELLTAQLGETGGETARKVAEWRREHELMLD